VKRQIATIGYEGTTIDAFIETLQRASITVLIDVREVALSRKKGFSKNQLASALAESGIEFDLPWDRQDHAALSTSICVVLAIPRKVVKPRGRAICGSFSASSHGI